jgi:SAM-dependent methyltransferase
MAASETPRDSSAVSSDGLPLPPPQLRFLVSGRSDTDGADFLSVGRGCAAGVLGSLQRASVSLESLRAVLDFGCGCGRVIRHLAPLSGARFYGTDYNLRLVLWCRRNLPFAHFGLNGVRPPLPYPDRSFDFIYAFSVFTHLPEDLQRAWLFELGRVLAPGGHLLITTHGEAYVRFHLGEADRARFAAGEMVVYNPDVAGRNECNVFQPPSYLGDHLPNDLETVAFVPGTVLDQTRVIVEQDIHMLRRAGG